MYSTFYEFGQNQYHHENLRYLENENSRLKRDIRNHLLNNKNIENENSTLKEEKRDLVEKLAIYREEHNQLREESNQLAEENSELLQKQKLLEAKIFERASKDGCHIDACYYEPAKVQVADGDAGFLGQGGYGKVRIAFTKQLDVAAIKYISLHGSSQHIELQTAKFIKEVENLHRASHANVVRIEGYSACQNTMAYIMEYMPGGNLNDLLLRKISGQFRVPIISPWLRLRFCCDITSGVAYLHHGFTNTDQRLVHGDLKPENILLTTDLRCKVADFGGADFSTCSEFVSQDQTDHLRREYTRGYVAPERSNNAVVRPTRPMDVYSVGMIMMVILRRKLPPIDGLAHSSEEAAHIAAEVDEVCRTQHPNEQNVIDLLKKKMFACCSKDAPRRPTIIAVRDEFLRFLGTRNVALTAQDVADVMKSLDIKMLSPDQMNCVSLDRFR